MDYQGLKIERLEHDGFRIQPASVKPVIYVDPYNLQEKQPALADFILITHDHFDHLSRKDIKKIATTETTIIGPQECKKQLAGIRVREIIYVDAKQSLVLEGLNVETVPAYNLNKFKAPGEPYHPKIDEKVGYVMELENVRIYHAGDTDHIPEMSQLSKIDIALLPVSGTYVMTWSEAVEAVKSIKPKLAIPMHFGSIVGSLKDAENFKAEADCPVAII